MKITANQLVKIFPQSKAVAQQYADLFNELFAQYGITEPVHAAGFISQVGHESGGFTRLVENLNYSAQGLASTWKNRYSTGKMIVVKGKRVPEPNALALSLHRRPEAIANNTYANRMGNGPESSGDGWKYRGRGLIQITGRYNYEQAAKATGLDLINHPELLEEPRNATIVSLDYWKRNGLSKVAATQDIKALTRAINGGLIGLSDREDHFEKALEVLAA